LLANFTPSVLTDHRERQHENDPHQGELLPHLEVLQDRELVFVQHGSLARNRKIKLRQGILRTLFAI
jgi:hypothetical protein